MINLAEHGKRFTAWFLCYSVVCPIDFKVARAVIVRLIVHIKSLYLGLCGKASYYIPITDTTLELSVFWPSDIESRINERRFSESISLSFKTRLTSVTCFCGVVT